MTNKITIQTVAVVDDSIAALKKVDRAIDGISGTATTTSQHTSKALDVIKGAAIAGFGALVTGATASVKAASDLQYSMSQIAALTDTPRAAIQDLTKDVIAMSREMPVSAKELAKGLYYISSSGIKGAAAIDVLRVSAKAASAGLGETKTIADAVTSALNAYKLEGADAARITDVLTQAVKEGKGEPDALAGALGRVLPIAAAAGVNIEQVAASLATMTRTGLTAEEAATALRGTIGALLAPSKQAVDALAGIGLTTEDVANKLKGDGLVSLLQMLMERTKGNVETLDAIIPNVRALTGVLSTAGSQGKAYAEVLLKMQNAAGTTDKAFSEMSNTFEFKLKKSQNAIENLGIAVGNKLLPPLSDAAEAVTVLINWQDKLLEAERGTEVQVRASAKSWDEYVDTMIGVTRAEEVRILLQRDMERGLLTQTEYEKELASVIGGVTRAGFDEARMLEQLTADLGDISAYTAQVESNASVEAQAILTAKQLKEQDKATKEMLDKMGEATINNYAFVESFKDFTAVSGAKQTISDLEELIKANPENRDKYAAQIRAISQQFGFTNVAMETGAATFRILEGLWQTGALTTETYAAALGRIKQAAADGKVSVDELGLKTGEAAAYMTAAATTAKIDQENIVNDARTNKEKMLDEMGNAMEGQQTHLQKKISDSMLSVSNALMTAASLATTKAGEIVTAWNRIPKDVTTTYTIVVNGSFPNPPTGGGYAAGGSFIVPPGYSEAAGRPYMVPVQSGEKVTVETPAQQRINNMTMNVYAQSAPNVIDEFGAMRAMLGA